jgi:hypothetical protein
MLQEMNPKHPLEADRRAAVPGLWVDRLDQSAQLAPGHDAIHLEEKGLASRRLAIALEVRRRQGHLLHRTGLSPRVKPCNS